MPKCVCCRQYHPKNGALCGPDDEWCQQCQKDGCPVPRKMPGNVSNLTPEQLTGLQDAVEEGAWENVKLILGVLPKDPFEDADPVFPDDYDDDEYDKAMEQAALEDGFKGALQEKYPGVEFPSVAELYEKVAKNKAKVNKVKWYDEPCPKHPHKPHCWEIIGLDRVLCLDCHKILDGGQYVNELAIQSPKHMKKIMSMEGYLKEAPYPGAPKTPTGEQLKKAEKKLAVLKGLSTEFSKDGKCMFCGGYDFKHATENCSKAGYVPVVCSHHGPKHEWEFDKYAKPYCKCGIKPDGITAFCLEQHGVDYQNLPFDSQKVVEHQFFSMIEKEVSPPMMVTSGPEKTPSESPTGDWYAKKAKEYNEKLAKKNPYEEITGILEGYNKLKKLEENLQEQIVAGMGVDLAKGQDKSVGTVTFGGATVQEPTYFVNEEDFSWMVSNKKKALSLMDPAHPASKNMLKFGEVPIMISKLVPPGKVYFVNPGLENPDPVAFENMSVPQEHQEAKVLVKKKLVSAWAGAKKLPHPVETMVCGHCQGSGSVPPFEVKQKECLVCGGTGEVPVKKQVTASVTLDTGAIKKKIQEIDKVLHPKFVAIDEVADLTEAQVALLHTVEMDKKLAEGVKANMAQTIMAIDTPVKKGHNVVGTGKGTVEAYNPEKHKANQIVGFATHDSKGESALIMVTGAVAAAHAGVVPEGKPVYAPDLESELAEQRSLVQLLRGKVRELEEEKRKLTMLIGKLYFRMRGPKTDTRDPHEAIRRRFENIVRGME